MTNLMNSTSDRDRRQRNGATRGRDLYWGFTIGTLSNLVTLFIIAQAGRLPTLAISAMIVATFVFVMINSFDCMDDLKANADDMDMRQRQILVRSLGRLLGECLRRSLQLCSAASQLLNLDQSGALCEVLISAT